jgi:hypothetical protein
MPLTGFFQKLEQQVVAASGAQGRSSPERGASDKVQIVKGYTSRADAGPRAGILIHRTKLGSRCKFVPEQI